MGQLFGVALVLLAFSLTLGALERRHGRTRRTGRSARERLSDLTWWLFGSFVNEPLKRAVTFAVLIALGVSLLLVLELPLDREGFKGLLEVRYGLGALPRWLGVPLTLLALDLILYAVHRLKHRGGLLWRAHAVHHSSEQLDWLAAARAHPLDEVATTLIAIVPVLTLGARLDWVAPIAPLLVLHGVALHADVPWRYGWLGRWVVSPAFHRWHHAKETPRAEGVNFGALFTIWDRLFGTFYLPDASPAETGVADQVPEGFIAQLLHPLRGRPVRD